MCCKTANQHTHGNLDPHDFVPLTIIFGNMLMYNDPCTKAQAKIKSGPLKKHCCTITSGDNRIKMKVVGIINAVAFQKARLCAEKLHQHLSHKYALPQIIEMFQIDWHEYIEKMKRHVEGKIYSLTRPVAVFINDEFIGSDVEFLLYINESYVFTIPLELGYYESIITERCTRFMEKSKRKYVYFTFTVEGSLIGSFVFMLYSDLLPLTCQHFLNLCTGYDEVTGNYTTAHYVNTQVHRIVKNGWIQCGGIEPSEIDEDASNDTAVIPDESYCIPHDRRGVLSMANDGKHYNESQFAVCLKPNPWMNYYYVAFGQLVDGARTLKTLESIPTFYEHPTKRIIISYCGEYVFGSEPKMEATSKIFLKHQRQPPTGEGEDMVFYDHISDYYSITPWLDNVVDRIDVRDTASLLITERYLDGLYCLPSDYAPGMDMNVRKEVPQAPLEVMCDATELLKIRKLFMHFHPDLMTEEEKLQAVSEISNVILAYIFNFYDNEYCLQHISRDTKVIIEKILEVAHKITLKAIQKSKGTSSISHACGDIKMNEVFKTQYVECRTIPKTCLSLLKDILNEAILYVMHDISMQE